ncbi:hypothetical protein [Methylorubrum extorquens]|uniref:Uncharacterized protein n=1 Tax=Methylorubrum extorquens (strain ATCC 14718 / DSM 1338 / JCM 2805 / NCIMB 9133 / AM1) TaxID=272630 RepID=C5AYK2_METEA|nr:hypothetical protein [Methylorubrum extorquens]ACS39118.1 Hypothetical protein MexAM1_META1p1254 [Methylorubrum extorquens AM1]MCP1542776.1 hypothetical protein [Methylorubrum extorquens]MCP1589879.1 hypothetical protein [Methylorubrum extorquens]
MTYFDELRDNAGEHFTEWLRALAAGESSARAAAWGLHLDLGGLSPAVAFERVAEAVDRYASVHRVLYAAACFGGPYDDEDAIESALPLMAVAVAEKAMTEGEREARLRARIVGRIREGSYDEADVDWLEIKAAGMSDAQVLDMEPFDGVGGIALGRRVVTCSTPVTDHWTRRIIEPGERHLLLRESVMGRETETRHSLLSAYLHVVAGDGGAAEFLEAYDEHIALAS